MAGFYRAVEEERLELGAFSSFFGGTNIAELYCGDAVCLLVKFEP